MSEKFPRSNRLNSENDFKNVWSKAKRLSSSAVTLVNCRNDLGHARLGLSISKKQIRHAVDRNRIKRVARETFRLHQTKLQHLDVIVIGYKGAALLSGPEQYQLFNSLWERLATQCKKFC